MSNLNYSEQKANAAAVVAALQAIQAAQESALTAPGAGAVPVTYQFAAVDFGAGDSTQVIAGPAGLRGRVQAVSVFNVSEAFTDDTTEARVDVGDGSDADEHALTADLGTTAIGAAVTPALTDGGTPTIPADQDVTLTFVAPTGGTPAGIADVAVTIAWFI